MRISEMVREAATFTASLADRKTAYSVAKDLRGNRDYGLEVQKAASKYFDLVHRHGTEKERESAAKALAAALGTDVEAAKTLIKVLNQKIAVMHGAAAEHRKLDKQP